MQSRPVMSWNENWQELQFISDKCEHFTVIEDTGVTEDEEFICNNNSDCEDVKLEPYKIYDQVKCEFCGENFNSKNSAGKVLVLTDHKCVEIILVSFGLVE